MNRQARDILLAEDNPDHAELVIRSLQDHKIANIVNHVKDGEEALDFLFNRGKYKDKEAYPTPDLILLDLKMPRLDGIGVLKQIKQVDNLKNIPVVVLSSSADDEDIKEAYKYNANSYLVKPLDFRLFVKLMESLGLYWLGWNKNVEESKD